MKANCAFLANFGEIITSNSYKKKLSGLTLEVKYVLEWVSEVDYAAIKDVYEIMKKKPDIHAKHLRKTMFVWISEMFPKEIRIVQVPRSIKNCP